MCSECRDHSRASRAGKPLIPRLVASGIVFDTGTIGCYPFSSFSIRISILDAYPQRGEMSEELPFARLRVVALEQAVSAPFCSRQLADLGADVIKVERPDGGDPARAYDGAANGVSAYCAWLNRGKRSVALDLKTAKDREVCARLVGRADVFVHNLAPGAVERLDLSYETLSARDPRLIWCGISGYGPDGPYRDKKAYDMLVQAESGVVSVTGSADAPAKVGISVADIASGLYAYSSILAALYHRQHTSRGQ